MKEIESEIEHARRLPFSSDVMDDHHGRVELIELLRLSVPPDPPVRSRGLQALSDAWLFLLIWLVVLVGVLWMQR